MISCMNNLPLYMYIIPRSPYIAGNKSIHDCFATRPIHTKHFEQLLSHSNFGLLEHTYLM
jgi:hypothetical protein